MPRQKSSASKPVQETAAAARPKRTRSTSTTTAASTTAKASKSKGSTSVVAKKRAALEEVVDLPAKRIKSAKQSGPKVPSRTKTINQSEIHDPALSKKSGHSRTHKPDVPGEEQAPPKRRGRPPKGGESVRNPRDDVAAAEQLEEELIEAVEEGQIASNEGTSENEVAGSTGKRYFLMKAEQVDRFETLKSGRIFNTKFTIDDLREKSAPEMWDGVRNFVARNVMQEMRKGDLAFFYGSGAKGGLKPGITGIVEIVKEAEPDPTTSDEDAVGFVEKESDRDKWVIVHVKFRKKLQVPVTLESLKKHSGTGKLGSMQMLTGARLSVSRVSPDEWDFILNELMADEDADARTL